MCQFHEASTTCCPRPSARQLLSSACLVTVFCFTAHVWAVVPLPRPASRILAASSNTSEPVYMLSNFSDKQTFGGGFGGNSGAVSGNVGVVSGGGNFVGGIVIGSCTHATEVSNIHVCNEGSIQVKPQIFQVYRWNLMGSWVAPNTLCRQFDRIQLDPIAAENVKIGFAYARPSDWWPKAAKGGEFSYKRSSPCVGVYRCTGNPLACSRSHAVTVGSLFSVPIAADLTQFPPNFRR